MPTIAELKEHLNTFKDEDIIAYDIWTPADAIWQAKREGYRLTQEQAEQVIEMVDHKKDAEQGINWDVLSCFLPERAEMTKIPEDCPTPDDSECGDCQMCTKGVKDEAGAATEAGK